MVLGQGWGKCNPYDGPEWLFVVLILYVFMSL